MLPAVSETPYRPLPSAPLEGERDLEEGASEVVGRGLEGEQTEEVKENTEPNSYGVLNRWVTQLEQDPRKDLREIFRRVSGGKWGIDQNHPFVLEFHACAKKVDLLYQSLNNAPLHNDQEIEQLQNAIKLQGRLRELGKEIGRNIPESDCIKCMRKVTQYAQVICYVSILMTCAYFLNKA